MEKNENENGQETKQAEEKENKKPATENTEAETAEKEPKEPSEAEKAQALAEDYKRKWYAVTAEYDNYRKRTANTASQKYAEGVADIVVKILPIGDNLDRALAVCDDEKMKQGLQMVKASFDKILSEEGIEGFDPAGEAFDPYTSVAITAMPAAEGEEEGIVKQTFEKGYKKGDKVLRLAKVAVTRQS